jgi:hypothetical protein
MPESRRRAVTMCALTWAPPHHIIVLTMMLAHLCAHDPIATQTLYKPRLASPAAYTASCGQTDMRTSDLLRVAMPGEQIQSCHMQITRRDLERRPRTLVNISTHRCAGKRMCARTHAHAPARVRAHKHTCAHTHTHPHRYSHAHSHTHARAHACIRTCTHTHGHGYHHARILVDMHNAVHTSMHIALIYTYIRVCIHVYMRVCAHMDIHTCIV